MKTPALTFFAFALVAIGAMSADSAKAQNAILAETYGQGVHAFNCGHLNEAQQYFTLAIDNGIQDPRAYYFRGIVAYASGREAEAEADWQAGAEMEANGRTNPAIGRSISRFQGLGRLKLEQIRQKARLQALAVANARSQQRYGEINANPENAAAVPPAPAPAPARPVAPPPTPPAADNPFADDNMAAGQPNITSDDALEGAMNDPFADDPNAAPAPAPAGGGNPFGGDAGGGTDPFGGGGAGDPFGGDAGGGADPFGGGGDAGDAGGGTDPFGGGGADPFGGNPFGN